MWVTIMEPGLARLTITGGGALRGEALPLLPFGMLATSDPGPVGGAEVADGFGVAGLLPATPPVKHNYREYEVAVRGFGPGGATLAERMAGRVAAWRASGRATASTLTVSAYPRESPGQGALALPARPGQVILDRPHTRLVLAWPAS